MAFADVLLQHRRRLGRLLDRRGAEGMRRIYDRAQAEVMAKLERLGRARRSEFTAHQLQVFLGQIRQGQAMVAQRLAGELGDLSDEAQREAIRGVVGMVTELERRYTGAAVALPVEEAGRFAGVLGKQRASLLRQHRESVARYGTDIITRTEQELAVSLTSGETGVQAVDRVAGVIDAEAYRAEVIGRTETSYAFNATHHDVIRDAREELPDLRARWVELVDDTTGRPLDERVAVDSLAIHGQAVAPGGVFVMPPSSPVADAKGRTEVPEQLVGKSWAHPPNRPNDRSMLVPWRAAWKIPAWEWRGGRRVAL